jgi:UDP-N-acetylglucosamine/UDP-N-acetylgalactosamine 4-epimerase
LPCMNILLTGGAGFVGSNLAKALLALPAVSKLVVIDNLSNGYFQNIKPFLSNEKFTFIQGDISDFDTCTKAMQGIDLVSHQAALGSVPRSINDPVASNNANVNGTLNIFTAAKNAGVKRVVYAASSSTYGDSESLPKIEDKIGKPLSPYAVTKYVMELYADVFAKTYNMEFIGLRYFNIFGPNQSPTGAYAAVIPLFIHSVLNNTSPSINGDGSNSRDFTFVENAVQANIKALFTDNKDAVNQIYNIALGESTTLLQLFNYIKEIGGSSIMPLHRENRLGDIPHSLASIDKAKKLLGYDPKIDIKAGLKIAYEWYATNKGYHEALN